MNILQELFFERETPAVLIPLAKHPDIGAIREAVIDVAAGDGAEENDAEVEGVDGFSDFSNQWPSATQVVEALGLGPAVQEYREWYEHGTIEVKGCSHGNGNCPCGGNEVRVKDAMAYMG